MTLLASSLNSLESDKGGRAGLVQALLLVLQDESPQLCKPLHIPLHLIHLVWQLAREVLLTPLAIIQAQHPRLHAHIMSQPAGKYYVYKHVMPKAEHLCCMPISCVNPCSVSRLCSLRANLSSFPSSSLTLRRLRKSEPFTEVRF